jgi:ribosomal protein S6--L-glutamate ligase
VSRIALWFYRNEGGHIILDQLRRGLTALGHEVYADFDMRRCIVRNGRVITEDGVELLEMDILYHMNADEMSLYQRDVLAAIERSGVEVINSYTTFIACYDKFVANTLLRQRGIRVPDATLVPPTVSLANLEQIFLDYEKVVVKRRLGHGGIGVQRFDTPERLFDFILATRDVFADYYLEKYVEFAGRDCRVDILDGRYIGGYSRRRNHYFKTNVHARAEMLPIPPTEEQIAYALQAAAALEIDATIIDMVVGSDEQLYVLEVNPILGVFTGVGLKTGVNTIQSEADIHPIFAYDDRKVAALVEFLDARARRHKRVHAVES